MLEDAHATVSGMLGGAAPLDFRPSPFSADRIAAIHGAVRDAVTAARVAGLGVTFLLAGGVILGYMFFDLFGPGALLLILIVVVIVVAIIVVAARGGLTWRR